MSNGTAIGYMILAMKQLDYTDEQIKEVERSMNDRMDLVTEERAYQVYMEF